MEAQRVYKRSNVLPGVGQKHTGLTHPRRHPVGLFKIINDHKLSLGEKLWLISLLPMD